MRRALVLVPFSLWCSSKRPGVVGTPSDSKTTARHHRASTALACGLAVLTMAAPSFAQGKGQGQGQDNKSPRPNNPPPSKSDLATPAPAQSSVGGGPFAVTPFAWIDDASLLQAGAVSIALSTVRWQGSGVSEVDAPVVDVAIGVARRVHLTATVPRVVGSADPLGAVGGIGTSYFSAKVAILDPAKHQVKVSVSPTLELLSRGMVETMGSDRRRVHVGLPVSAEIARGPARLYAGSGFFSRGIAFAGGGLGLRAAEKLFVSVGYNRSWRTRDAVAIPLSDRARSELTGSASYAVTPIASVFGSIGRTIKTLDENGAGTTFSCGLAFYFAPVKQTPASASRTRHATTLPHP